MNKYQTTGIIFASGEGSRMRELSLKLGIPKHLFPVGDSTITGRLIKDYSNVCDEILLVTQAEYVNHFQSYIAENNLSVRVIEKKQDGFVGDFDAINEAKNDHIVLTMGDLIFPEGELSKFVAKVNQKRSKAYIALDASQLKVVDFRIVSAAFPKTMLSDISARNPESFLEMSTLFLRYFLKLKVALTTLKTLFNVNTPEVYEKVKEKFK